jgi:peptide/nickel transport system substrate-binding protein
MYWLVVNAVKEDSPFTNQLVRQAVALSIDRKQIANMLGGAQPSTAFAPMFNACDANQLDIFERDVKRAKALLKEAGVGKLTLDMPNVPGAVNDAMYAVLQKNFADIGITVNIENMDEGTWVSKVWVDNPMSVDLTGLWYAGYSDAIMVPLWLNPNKAGFTGGYQIDDAEMNAAVDGLRGLAGDDPKRPDTLQNVCNMIHTQANHIPLVTRQETMAYRSDLIDASGIKHIDGYANNLADVETYTLH